MNRSTSLLIIVTVLACAGREEAPPSDSTAATETAVVASGPAIDSGAPRLEPRDEANASFRAFRERLLAAISSRDTAFLHSIVSSDIRTSFGADGGIKNFKEMWKTADSSSAIWGTLSRVLRMGGRHDADTSFFAPYVYAFWPDTIDAFSFVAVTSPRGVVRARPEPQSDVIGSANYSILRVLEWKGIPADVTPSSWARVEMPDKRSGWIAGGDVYSPVSWRAAFVRRGDQWVMILFVAGD